MNNHTFRLRSKKIISLLLAFIMVFAFTPQTTAFGGIGGVTGAIGAMDINDSLVLNLPFNNSIADASPVANPVVVGSGTAAYTTGVNGDANGAFNFSGNSTYLNLGTSAELNPASFTTAFWVKPNGSFSGENIFIWTKANYNTAGWYICTNSDTNVIVFSIGVGTGGSGSGQPLEFTINGTRSSFFPANTWVHIAATYDAASKTAHIYRNGIEQTAGIGNTTAAGTVTDGGATKMIGRNGTHNSTLANYAMDDVIIAKAVLSQSAIIDLYKQALDFDGAQLVAADRALLTLPASTDANIALPYKGANGSNITWTSSNPAVLDADGHCNPPATGSVNVTLTARLTYDGAATEKVFTISVIPSSYQPPANPVGLIDVGTDNVRLLDKYLLNAEANDVAYLLSLDPERFLYHFYKTAGLTGKMNTTTPYDTLNGVATWERTTGQNFRGHMFGHWIGALALAYRSANTSPGEKSQLLAKIQTALAGLKACQDAYAEAWPSQAGFIAPFGERRLYDLDRSVGPNDGVALDGSTLVPYYNLHKVLEGLLQVYTSFEGMGAAGDTAAAADTAIAIASGFGTYINTRVTGTGFDKARMQATEYGGMNEALYELYNITGDPKHKVAAEAFDETSIFTQIANGQDILSGRHANTTIPKFIGALKRYEVMMENPEYYNALSAAEKSALPGFLLAAEKFFDIVVENHAYITGDNSVGEHFRDAGQLAYDAVTRNPPETCETCNAYNMLKLARELFKITNNKKYSDYYERTFINTIVSSQNPETGGMTYFNPMYSGYFKVTDKNRFWCCQGTGIENHVKYGDSLYFRNAEGSEVYANTFYSSILTIKDRGLSLTQSADFPVSDTLTFTVAATEGSGAVASGTALYIRVPDWIGGDPTVKVNGLATTPVIYGGYIKIEDLSAGQTIEVRFPQRVEVWDTADNANFVAFRYGPAVLSAQLGTANMATENTGILVLRSNRLASAPNTITILNGQTPAEWKADIAENLVRIEDSVKTVAGATTFTLTQPQFKLIGTDQGGLVYTPHYAQYDQRYGMYMNIAEPDSEAYQKQLLEAKIALREQEASSAYLGQIDNNNYEAAFNVQHSSNSSVGPYNGRNYRDAQSGGWFSYDMPIALGVTNYLNTTYTTADVNRSFAILINDTAFVNETIVNTGVSVDSSGFYVRTREIPSQYTGGEAVRYKEINGVRTPYITIRFSSTGGLVGGVYGVSITQAFSTKADLTSLSFSAGELAPAFSESVQDYTLTVPPGTQSLRLKAAPYSESGLVFSGNLLFDDSQQRAVLTSAFPATIKLTSIGQNFVNSVSLADQKANTANGYREYTITIVEGTPDPFDTSMVMAYTMPVGTTGSNASYMGFYDNSLHLAYSTDGSKWTALNDNKGILFYRHSSAYNSANAKEFRDPFIFRKQDGSYVLLATAVRYNNAISDTSIICWDSTDLKNFSNQRLLTLSSGTVYPTAPQAIYDEAVSGYRIIWKASSGSTLYTNTINSAFTTPAARENYTGAAYPVALPADADVSGAPAGALVGSVVAVTDSLVQGLKASLGTPFSPIASEELELATLKGSVPKLPETTTVRYSDGSSEALAVKWDAEAKDPGTYAQPGTVKVTGHIEGKPDYVNPINKNGADPDIFKGPDGKYYYTSSYMNYGQNNVANSQYDRIIIRQADSIQGLSSAEERTVFWRKTNGAPASYHIWAPEIHYVQFAGESQGKWVIYFAGGRSNSTFDLKVYAIVCDSQDPMTGNWSDLIEMAGYRASGTTFDLDATVFQHNGEWYMIWASKPNTSNLVISKMINATTLADPLGTTTISTPEYTWENRRDRVMEGATVMKAGGRILLGYAAGSTDATYCIGLLSAADSPDTNLLDPASWVKTPYPLMISSPENSQFGPGHATFTVAEDGVTPILSYHARPNEAYSGVSGYAPLYDATRYARVAIIYFHDDGMPYFSIPPKDGYLPGAGVTANVEVLESPLSVYYSLKELKAGDNLEVTAYYANATGDPVSGHGILAIYDALGRSLLTKSTTFSAPVGGNAKMKVDAALPANLPDGATAKFFLWNEAFAPLTEPADFVTGVDPDIESGMFLWYKFDAASGTTVTDYSGKGNDGEIRAASGTLSDGRYSWSGGMIGSGLTITPSGTGTNTNAYIEAPRGIVDNKNTLTVSVLAKHDLASGSTFLFAIGPTTAATPANYAFMTHRNVSKYVITNGNYAAEQGVNVTNNNNRNVWELLTAVQTPGRIILYRNGVEVGRSNVTPTTTSLGSNLYVWLGRSFYNADPLYSGTYNDVRIYDRELSAAEISFLYDSLFSGAGGSEGNGRVLPEALLSDHNDLSLAEADGEAIMYDVKLPLSGSKGSAISWTSLNPELISNDGKITRPGSEEPDKTAILVATLKNGKEIILKTFKITVKHNLSPGEIAAYDAAHMQLVNLNDVRGHINMPLEGELGSTISWTSGDNGLITATGEVNRPAYGSSDAVVTLTATASYGGASATFDYSATVKAKPRNTPYGGYFLGYFGDNSVNGEQIRFSVSNGNSPTSWTRLNNGNPMMTSVLGTQGLRDPFVIRSPEGDKFYMIATDLSIGRNGNWTTAQTRGSQYIEVWESNDLVTWSEQRHVKVSPDSAGNTWAPEAYWDDSIGAYVVFWASCLYDEGSARTAATYNRMMYTTTRDFVNFTEPKIWQDDPVARIDTTVIKANGMYYRFTKNEGNRGTANPYGKDIFVEKNVNLRDTDLSAWTSVGVDVGKKTWNNGGSANYEGPVIFKSNPGDPNGDGYYFMADNYGGVGYRLAFGSTLESDRYPTIVTANFGGTIHHGTVASVTEKERRGLLGESYAVPTTVELVAAAVSGGWQITATVKAGDNGEVAGTVVFLTPDGASQNAVLTDGKASLMYTGAAGTVKVSYAGYKGDLDSCEVTRAL